jgi:hypothetical protein
MAYIDPDMPDEFQTGRMRFDDRTTPIEHDQDILDQLSVTIAQLRDGAVDARKASGLEEIFTSAEEAYLGIDDMNRHQFSSARWAKPTTMNAPLTSSAPPSSLKSTAYVRMTARYVDMGAAKISEITLPIDDKAFSIKATPIPDLGEDPKPLTQDGQQVFRPGAEGEQAMMPATDVDLAKANNEKSDAAAKRAEKRIYDWMLESNYPAEMRKVHHDSALFGSGVLKGPFPKMVNQFHLKAGKLVKTTKVIPGMKRVSPWNIYPDPACGEDIHEGDYIFESDRISPNRLKKLKEEKIDNTPIYISAQINKVLAEGPDKINLQENTGKIKPGDAQYTIWYFTGTVSRDDMRVAQAYGIGDLPDEVHDVNAIIAMVNDTVIRATINPLESGALPYRVMPWTRRNGSWIGIGAAEQLEMPQRSIVAATRALFNNAGVSSGSQIVMNQHAVYPANGRMEITPDKLWFVEKDVSVEDVRDVFHAFQMPNIGTQLMNLVMYANQLAEQATNIPLLSQGKDRPDAPQTLGQAELEDNNAHTLIRSIAYTIDDNITEPLVKDLYEWLRLDPAVPEDEKGDFEIDAKGSITMVEKAIQETVFAQLMPFAKDPAYGMNPKLVAEKYLRSKRLNPGDVSYTEAELEAMSKQPPPEDPTITAAKIRAEAQIKTAEGHDKATVAKSQADTDRDTLYANAEAQRSAAVSDVRYKELELKLQLAQLDYANKHSLKLEEVKAKLAETAMKLNVQKQLSEEAMDADLHKHHNPSPVIAPPTEPAGRAADGQAFVR